MQQNHALIFLAWLGRLIRDGKATVSPENPLVVLLNPIASGHFLLGRDESNQPFLGVPTQFMPYFVQIDWMEVSFCRDEGYLYLEARDPSTQALHMALGICVRRSRLNTICLEGKEDPGSLSFSMFVFKQNEKKPDDTILSNQAEITGFPVKEIGSIMELGTESEIESALRLYERTGMGSGFTSLTL